MQKIPITAGVGSQSFRITLNSVSYVMTTKWNDRAEFWTLDIADENEVVIIANIALKSGLDLLSPFNIDIGSLYVISESGQFIEATFDNISIDTFLIYIAPDETNG